MRGDWITKKTMGLEGVSVRIFRGGLRDLLQLGRWPRLVMAGGDLRLQKLSQEILLVETRADAAIPQI